MPPRIPPHVVAAGVIGCSAAAVYYTFGVSSANKESSHAMTGPSESPAPIATGLPPNTPDPLATAITVHKTHKKSIRQRVTDNINRRRAQHKFPYNAWWTWKRRREGVCPDTIKDSSTRQSLVPTTAEVADRFSHVIDDVKCVARALLRQDAANNDGDMAQLAPRFDDLEITRYAIHYGLLRIDENDAHDRSSNGYRMVVQDAAEGIADSQQWFNHHVFASIQQLHKDEYSNLIRWEYDSSEGRDARPILHVDVGKAVEICDDKSKQKEFANLVLTMMELASLNSPLTGIDIPPGGIDRIDVAIYARGTNTMNATRAFWILRAVVKTVSHHYPGRLNMLVLHDLPTFLNWVVLGVKKLVHPETAKKFVVM